MLPDIVGFLSFTSDAQHSGRFGINYFHSDIEKNNNTRTVQAESSKFASLSFDQGFQIVIPPRIVANVPEPIGTPSDNILH